MSELKPCPFCGGTDLGQVHRTTQNYVSCHSCGVRMTQSDVGYGDAQKLWNRRAQPAQATSEIREIPAFEPAQAGQVLTHRDVLEEWTNTTLEPCTHQEAFVRGARWAEQAVLAKRVPMTDAQIDESMRAKFYPARNRAFVDGVEAAERHHGIVGEKGGA